jgi:FkbM family methyltransferase
MNRRIEIAKHWLLKNKNNVGVGEILKNVFDATCDIKAKKYIDRIQEDEQYHIVYLTGIREPIYYPKTMPFHSLSQVITESFYPSQWHYYEIPETTVSPEDVVVDCGAAEGLFSLLIVNRCAKIYAIEPLPTFVKAMQRTFAHAGNIEILPYGLAESPGVAYMDDNSIASAVSDKGNTRIELKTIDNLFYEQGIAISYLKADLEGFEMNMLRGASKTIAANKPKVAITTYHKKEHAGEIQAFLKDIRPDYNFKLKGIEERDGSPVMLHAW